MFLKTIYCIIVYQPRLYLETTVQARPRNETRARAHASSVIGRPPFRCRIELFCFSLTFERRGDVSLCLKYLISAIYTVIFKIKCGWAQIWCQRAAPK